MHAWVAVDLTGGGLENGAPEALGKPRHIDRAVHAGFGGLHGIVLVVDRQGRAGDPSCKTSTDAADASHHV